MVKLYRLKASPCMGKRLWDAGGREPPTSSLFFSTFSPNNPFKQCTTASLNPRALAISATFYPNIWIKKLKGHMAYHRIAAALRNQGWSEEEIRKELPNALRVIRESP